MSNKPGEYGSPIYKTKGKMFWKFQPRLAGKEMKMYNCNYLNAFKPLILNENIISNFIACPIVLTFPSIEFKQDSTYFSAISFIGFK